MLFKVLVSESFVQMLSLVRHPTVDTLTMNAKRGAIFIRLT